MAVQPMASRMPLRHPQVRHPVLAQTTAKVAKEHRDIAPKHTSVMAALSAIRERDEPIQPVRRAVTPDLAPGTSISFQRRTLRIRTTDPAAGSRRNQAAAGLPSIGIEAQRPMRTK